MPSFERASQTMQRQQMAVVLVRAIKEIAGVDLVAEYKKANFVTEIGDLDKAYSAEQRTAIVALEYAGITNVAHFNPGNSVTRGQFASFLYRTIENVVNNPEAGVAAVKAINNTTVEVTFDEEVDNVQALNFLISDLEVKNAAVKLTNKKVVVLTTAAQTADKEYTVSLGEEKIGTFKGIAAVVPTKVDLVEKSVQGKLGQQVTLKAQVTVAEGQAKAGIPVTFFIPGSSNGVKTPVTVEAVTNEEGIATYSYTRYAATNDTVTVYANGDRSKFSTGYVFWAVDQTLEITEVTTGATINNGANKTYKVTYKHPETGKPVSGKVLNVSVKENIDVTVDKLQNVTVNGLAVVQTSDNNTRAAQITTDSKGEATFTVSGSNAEVTPVVFEATPVTVTNANGTVTTTGYTQKYTADTLQASAAKVTFGAIQAAYTLEVTRDGGEVAATGLTNGRKYNLVVKDKDGKLAANETVNVAFNEDIDGVISTVTSAQFVKVENGKQVAFEGKKITVKTNSKGEASFVIGTDLANVNTYATPIAWIDINNQSGKDANLDKGEPSAVAPISYFQAAYLDGSKLVSKNAKGDDTEKFDGGETATFEVQLTNQSGKVVPNSGYTTKDVTYTVYNTGANNVKVGTVEIAPNRVHTVVAPTGKIDVTSVEGKTSSVKVLATGVAKEINGNKEFAFTAKEATATFTNAGEITNPYTGVLDLTSINKKDKEIKFVDKSKAVAYAGETGKTYKYFGIGNTTISSADAFISLLEEYKATNKVVRATYEVKDDVVTFTIISENTAGNNNGAAGKLVSAVVTDETPDVAGLVDTITFTFDKAVDATTVAASDFTGIAGYALTAGSQQVSGTTVKFAITPVAAVTTATVTTVADSITVGSKVSKLYTNKANTLAVTGTNAVAPTITIDGQSVDVTVAGTTNAADFNGLKFEFKQNSDDTLKATYNSGVVNIALPNATPANATAALIKSAINALGSTTFNGKTINLADVNVAVSGAGLTGTTISGVATLANGVSGATAVKGEYNFAVYPTLVTGDKVTINGITYTKVVTGASVAANKTFDTTANLLLAIKANDPRFDATSSEAAGVFTLIDAAATGAAAPTVSVN
ncbi:hypothetical protein [Lysinibacillus sp. C5.1]|uniref:hypothetical protein n=1 Tax=Lysinibacillus sp. C5.1 TaxID=2796169 RepID=UPI00308128CD